MNKILNGSTQPVDLGPGYRVRASGWQGKVSIHTTEDTSTRSSEHGIGIGLDLLDNALRRTEITQVRRIELELSPAAPASYGNLTRSLDVDTEIELEVPDAGPEFGQLVISVDDDGAVRWHLPEMRSLEDGRVNRGSAPGITFHIAFTSVPPPDTWAANTSRSLLGAVGRRLLKVLVYPITDPLVGAIAEFMAQHWEANKRPYRLRLFTPTDYGIAQATVPTATQLKDMANAGPILLFVHGTFSTSHGGFGDLPKATMEALHEHYDGRVLAFDHPTLSVDPFENVRWLVSHFPTDPVVIDIICHSRGGLVSRALAEVPVAARVNAPHITVRKLVLGATPNKGTLLADPDHMVSMIDRLTTALTLLPGANAIETLEALITVIKTLAHGGLNGLDGLRSMCPKGTFLHSLNITGGLPGKYFAIAANYEPKDRGLRALVTGGTNIVADTIFGEADNDLVVPTDGVYEKNGNARFPVPIERRLVLDRAESIMHTTIFGHPSVSTQLIAWLC